MDTDVLVTLRERKNMWTLRGTDPSQYGVSPNL